MAKAKSKLKNQKAKNHLKQTNQAPIKNSIDAEYYMLHGIINDNYTYKDDDEFLKNEAIDDYIANVYGNPNNFNFISNYKNYERSSISPLVSNKGETLAQKLEEMHLHKMFISNPLFGEVSSQYVSCIPENLTLTPKSKKNRAKTKDDFITEDKTEIFHKITEKQKFLQYELECLQNEGIFFDSSSLSSLNSIGIRKKKISETTPKTNSKNSLEDVADLMKIRDDLLYNWLPSSLPEYILPSSFNNKLREKFHEIASHLGCSSKSHGPKSSRTLVIKRTDKTPIDYSMLGRKPALAITSLFLTIFKHQERNSSFTINNQLLKSSQKVQIQNMKNTIKKHPTSRPSPGQIIGESAPPISEENVGNILLRKMGWSPGSIIGKKQNIDNHNSPEKNAFSDQALKVVFRKKNSGLGNSF